MSSIAIFIISATAQKLPVANRAKRKVSAAGRTTGQPKLLQRATK
jgi:hypothetical protein